MKRKKNTRFNLKPRTVAVIIIATIIGSMGGFLNDTLYDFSAVDENKITIKHINSIHDGDTINITTHNNKKVKIRLYGIDAPELKQPFGEQSQLCLEEMIKNQNISYIPRNKNKSTDKYGRTVAVIFKGNTNINLEMVKKGCAWNYMYYNKSLYTIFAQITAKNKKAGLHYPAYLRIYCIPIPPTPICAPTTAGSSLNSNSIFPIFNGFTNNISFLSYLIYSANFLLLY